MLRITHENYTMHAEHNGVRQPDQTAHYVFVENFLRARDFFESIGGTEEHTKNRSGAIVVKATSPDGLEVRTTVFAPVPRTRR